jgi:excinuclease ABC subunit B
LGKFDILIGINLLREGLDLPEVSLVTILDADKEGFLRSTRSIIQIAGRAARNAQGRIILYGDTITKSMAGAISECERRRTKQIAHNEEHGIVPQTIQRIIREDLSPYREAAEEISAPKSFSEKSAPYGEHSDFHKLSPAQRNIYCDDLKAKMIEAAANLEFEKAARYRDTLAKLQADDGP